MLALSFATSARRRSGVKLSVLNSLEKTSSTRQYQHLCDHLTIDVNEMAMQYEDRRQSH